MSEATTIFRSGECVREIDGREVRRWQGAGCVVDYTPAGAAHAQAILTAPRRSLAQPKTQAIPPTGEELPSAPFVRGSRTSHAAAEAIEGVSGQQRSRVLAWFVSKGHRGGTSDELEDALGLSHQSAGPRIRELEKAGQLNRTTNTRPTRSGRAAGVLVATGIAQEELFAP